MEPETQLELFNRTTPPPHPGLKLKGFLDELGWSQLELAQRLRINRPATINNIITGNQGVTTNMAMKLAQALGTKPDYWVRLQAAYDLHKEIETFSGTEIEEHSRIFDIAPVKEMEKRGWIDECSDMASKESEVCGFFEINSLDEQPALIANARATNSSEGMTPVQKAWCYRALKLSRTLKAKRFSKKRIPGLLKELNNLSYLSQSTEDVSWLLADYGIRYVVVEQLSRCKIDGAAFWIDDHSPVIAMSLRLDRIDNFWFVLMHELSHIIHNDRTRIDADLQSIESLDEIERRANKDAAEWLVPHTEINSFIRRTSPLYNKNSIIQFANRMRVHPGIIVGQLQHRGEISYSQGRRYLLKIRKYVTNQALTDGWGAQAPKL